MEPALPTSFIPKRPVNPTVTAERPQSRTVGLLSVLTGVFVVATALAFVGVYLYNLQLQKQRQNLQQNITQAKDGLGTDFVADMKRLNARIEGVKTLIKNHIVVTPIFDALQATTLRNVQYDKFSYVVTTNQNTKQPEVEVKLTGSARSYAAIALQSDAYVERPLIKNPVFSNLTIDEKTGRVGFDLAFSVDAADLSYQKFIDSKAPSTAAPVTQPVNPPLTQ